MEDRIGEACVVFSSSRVCDSVCLTCTADTGAKGTSMIYIGVCHVEARIAAVL
jgi:hypothetical protein